MPEPNPQLAELPPLRLFAARAMTTLLLSMCAFGLFGDFLLWAICGTRFIKSPQFHSMQPMFQGFGVIFLFLFMAQAKEDWKQRRPHFVLFGILVFVLAAIPAAPAAATLLLAVSRKGLAIFSRPPAAVFVLLVVLAITCKWKAFYSIWSMSRSVYEPQEARRIVIPDADAR